MVVIPFSYSFSFLQEEKKKKKTFFRSTAKTDQTGQMPMLNLVFAGGHKSNCWFCCALATDSTI